MNCYYHRESAASGICKNCNKGVCTQCAIDVGNGIACRNSCEQAVKEINAIIQKNKKVYKITRSNYYRMAAIYGLLGSFFIIYPLIDSSPISHFLFPVGACFLMGMLLVFYSGMKWESK
ncbi:hypothetical protein [Candidatus Protochlamydia phocaeensis]|uniref:hypothetical protein n=1 Tax=Candidatus Protochlamydia phocaeensis TaxID=1414722 RepID=UPI000838935B|nr:hypothetical protein [Candidatus Protochlamydia phocaeensis]